MRQLNLLQNNDDKGIAPLLYLGKDRKLQKKVVRIIPFSLEASETVLLSAKLVNVNNIDPMRPGFLGKFLSMISLRLKKHVLFP